MKIYRLTQVTVIRISDSPLRLVIHAAGQVPTTGWTNPQLDQILTFPDDRVLDFDFNADPPQGIVGDIVLPIHANKVVESNTPVVAITVYSRTNHITVHAADFVSPTDAAAASAAMAPAAAAPSTGAAAQSPRTITTLIAGEEHPSTTALGEEGPTTFIVGEEGPSTWAIGEEHPTTFRIGEEHPTTLIAGEEGPTTLIAGEETITNPQLDDPTGSVTTQAIGEEQGGGPFGGF